MTVEKKVALITGGVTGVGRATALRLVDLNYRVALIYSRSGAEADQTESEIRARGGEVLVLKADVANDEECRGAVEMTTKTFGRIDVLVNSAGTTQFIPFADLDAVTDDVWDRLFRVNVVGAFHCARAVRKSMLAVGGGVIINVSSTAAQLAQGSSIPYCCTKSALDNLTVSLARTLAPEIRVNAVAPGFIAGRWTENGLGEKYESVRQAYEQTLPMKDVCRPEDVADAIISLVTGSRLVTGQKLTVDAGMTISGYQVRYH